MILAATVAACGAMGERPPSADRIVTIHVEAVGLTAEEVEARAVLPIERAVSGVGRLRSMSTAGHAVVTVALERGADELQARHGVTERLAATSLPDDVDVHLGAPSPDDAERYVLRSDHLAMAELRTLQDLVVRPQLLTVEGVADVASCGGAMTAIEIAVDADRLQALDISIKDVLSALSQSIDSAMGGGYVSQGGAGDFLVRGGGTRLEDLETAQIALLHGGVPVLLRDVAQIARRDRRAPCQATLDDGTAVVTGRVPVARGQARDVRARMEEIRAALPPDVQVEWLDASVTFRLSTMPGDDATMQDLAERAARTAGQAQGVERAIALFGVEPDNSDRLPGEIDVQVALTSSATPAQDELILRNLLAETPGVVVRRTEISSGLGLRRELVGSDRDSLANSATELHRVATSIDGVEAVVAVGVAVMPRRSLTMDRDRMRAVGVTPRDVDDTLRLATDGYEIGTSIEGAQRIPIQIRWADIGREPRELGRIPLRASNGSWLVLQDVVRVKIDEAPVALLRTDGTPSMTIWVELAAGARGAEAELRRRIADVPLASQESMIVQ